MATRDVQLIIKARDEASRVFSTISGSVATLIGSQDKLVSSSSGVASGMASVLAQAKTFDSAFAKISGAADRAEASFTRQQQALAESRSAYAATATELLNLASAQERLQSTIVDQRLAGEDTSKSVAQLQAVVAALDKQAATRARLKTSIVAQESALATEASAMQQLGSIAIATEQALAALTDEQNRQVRAATAVADAQENAAAASARAAEMQARIAASTGTGRVGRSAADSASVFAADFDNAAAAAERLRQRTDPLYAIQAKLNNELAEAQVLYRKGALSADQLADAERRLKIEAEQAATALDRQGRGEMGKPSLFGLKPYELTNLGYQVNDVFTQLASGTSITQTLAQQGGQILQLLPGIGAGLVKAFTNPLVLAGIAAIAGISVVFVKAANDAERLRGVEGILAGIAGESKQSAQDLAGIAERLEDIGLSAEESLAAVRGFLTQGLNTEYLTAFASMAKQVAVVTGEDLPDAMEKLQDAFSGGYDAIAELDDQLQFLTVSEREQIRALFDAGKASEAREIAVRKLSEQLRDQARASGDAKGALASLTEGLDNFFDALADTAVVKGFIELLNDLGSSFAALMRDTANVETIQDLNGQIAEAKRQMALVEGTFRNGLNNDGIDRQAKRLREEIAELTARRDKLLKGPTGDTVDEASGARTKRRNERLEELRLEQRANNAKTDAQQIRVAGEQAYREEIRKTGDAVVAATARQIAEDKKRADLRAAQAKKERDTIKLSLPVDGRITSGFGTRIHPVTGKSSFHGAIDIAAPKGTPVKAAADAVVGKVKTDPLLGKYVELDHGKGLITIYGHLSDNSQVEEGDIVKRGDTIGKVGSTGRSTGNHTHFAARLNGTPVDPTKGSYKAGLNDAIGDAAKAAEKLAEQQSDFNAKIDEENEKRRQSIAYLEQASALSGDAVFDAERKKEIDEELFKADQEAKKKGLELDKQRRDLIAETVGKEYDLINARERANRGVDDATGERRNILELLDQARELGDTGATNRLEVELAAVEDRLQSAIEKAIEFWKTMGDSVEARNALAGLDSLRNSIKLDSNRRGADLANKPVNDLQAQRSGLMEQISFFQEIGQGNVVEELKSQLRQVNADLLVGIDAAIAYYRAHQGPEAQAAILGLENMRNQVMAASLEFQITAGQIQQAFAGSLVDSVNTFAERLVETRNPLVALRDAALQFGADFLSQIAQMLLQMAALQVASKIGFGKGASGLNSLLNVAPLAVASTQLSAAGTQVQAAGVSMVTSAVLWQATAASISAAAALLLAANAAGGAGIFHGGGIAGSANRSRRVSPVWFAAATRYHTGGIAGLRPNEVPAILERGEEIITKNDARHRNNGGGADGGSLSERVNVTVQNLLDSGDIIEQGLSTRKGEQKMLNLITKNRGAIRAALDN